MTERTCVIDGCAKPENARGWCKGHYYRWTRYDDPLASAPPRPLLPPKPKLPCSVDDCERPRYGLGLCEPHYARQRPHGGLQDRRACAGDPAQRFWPRVDTSGDCWLWAGPVNGSGYGSINVKGKILGVHVFAVILDGRSVPDGMEVDHLCYTPACVRPDHLDVVTHHENIRRATARRRTTAA